MKGLDVAKYFETVNEIEETNVEHHKLVLCHYPMMSWNRSHYGSYLVFGHIHNDTNLSFWPMIRDNDHMLNAGVDINGFYPVEFRDLIENNARFKAGH